MPSAVMPNRRCSTATSLPLSLRIKLACALALDDEADGVTVSANFLYWNSLNSWIVPEIG